MTAPASGQTKAATTTTLTVTSGGQTVTTIASGTMVTLTATVKAGAAAVAPGQVDFCDASAQYCTDIHILGMAQLTSAGTAVLHLRPGPGAHSYRAVFAGTNSDASSSSSSSSLTVTGLYPTATALAASGGIGSYVLTASVAGFGSPKTAAAPTGTISFLDTTTNHSVVTTAPLAASPAGPAFLNAGNPVVGSLPSSIIAGDFNGDGNPDLAVGVNTGSTTVAILLGDGQGNFTLDTKGTITASGSPVLAQDFNGDGIPDLLLADSSSGTLTVLLGNGDGTFTVAPGGPISGYGPAPVVAADFNGDGIPDLAMAGASYLTILLGNGDGTFTQVPLGSSSSLNGGASSMVTGDFSGDGIPDLAVLGLDGEAVTIFLGKGDGAFTQGTSVTVNTESAGSPVTLTTADFNGDGKLDLAVPIYGSSGAIAILLGNGDGSFQPAPGSPLSLAGLSFVRSAAVGDFNGDGNADLLLRTDENVISTSDMGVLLGNGDGTFSAMAMPTSSSQLTCCSNPVLGDWNGDGVTDIASPDPANSDVQVLLTSWHQSTTTVSNLPLVGPGPHLVEASYSGDSNYSPGVSTTVSLGVQAATPVISPGQGTYTSAQTVTLTDASPGVTIYYSLGGAQGNTSPAPYTGPLTISAPGFTTTSAYASGTGYEQSAPATVNLYLNLPQAATPSISLAAGVYPGTQTVTLTDSMPGTTIYYTTNGSVPSNYTSQQYTGPITVSSSEVLSAAAIAPGYSMSTPAIAQYTISSVAASFIYTVPGDGTFGWTGDGGPATMAELTEANGIAVDSSGNLYFSDQCNNVIRKVAAGTGIISTIAGTGTPGYSGDGGPAASAQLNRPGAMTVDSAGNLYIADSGTSSIFTSGDEVVRKIAAATGIITTVAGNGSSGSSGDNGPATSASFTSILGLATDSAGDLYISDGFSFRVRKIAAGTGIITTVAGTGTSGYSGDGGLATNAALALPEGIAVDRAGNLYIADPNNNVVREVNAATQVISTIAGGTPPFPGEGAPGGYSGDGGPAIGAKLHDPTDVVLDGSGNVYIMDSLNYVVREITAASGIISTFAGNGAACSTETGDGDPATAVELCPVVGTIAMDAGGNLYIVNGSVIRKVLAPAPPPAAATPAPTFSVAAGSYDTAQTLNVTDSAPGASIYLTLDGSTPTTGGQGLPGPIRVDGPVTVKAVAVAPGYLPSAPVSAAYTIAAPPPATVTTVAGSGIWGTPVSGVPALSASLGGIRDVVVDKSGDLYVADPTNNVVWMVSAATGNASIVAGTPGSSGFSGNGGPATSALLNDPTHVALDSAGNLYISDTFNYQVREVSAQTRIITTYAGIPVYSQNLGDGGPATSASLSYPEGIAFDAADNLYIADSNDGRVRMVSAATGNITTVAGGSATQALGDQGPATSASLSDPIDVALDRQGNLFILDGSRVREVTASTGIIHTVVGDGIFGTSGDGGPAVEAELNPYSITVDAAGDLYITDTQTIREVPAGSTTITTIAGNGYSGFSGDRGSARLASFSYPGGMSFDSSGALYVTSGSWVRKITFTPPQPAAAPVFSVAAGTYSSDQTVTITDSTPGATIYYTTDGTTPSTNSTVYSGPISVAQSETLEAMAVANGYATSSVTIAKYTIQIPVTPTVTVTPSASTITTQQSLSVSVVVSGGSGNATPTGTVTLSGGGYSGQQALASGTANFTIAAGSLTAGTDALTATYVPDTDSSGTYTGTSQSVSVAVSVAIGAGTATVTVTPASAIVTDEQAVSVAVSVAGGSGQPMPTGSITLTAGSSTTQQALSSGSATFQLPAGILTDGSDTVTATYSGDAAYAIARGTATITVAPVTMAASAPSPISPGSRATVTLTFAAGSTYAGTMNLTCALATSPSGVQSPPTCSLNPGSVSVATDGEGSSVLTIQTTAASNTSQLSPFGPSMPWLGRGCAALAVVLLFGLPVRRRPWMVSLMLIGFLGIASIIGCGGGNTQGSTPPPSSIPATTGGNYVFTVTATDSANPKITTSATVTVTVE